MSDDPETHPIQIRLHPHKRPQVRTLVTSRAYEVYCHLFGEQPAMMRDGCRGGFGGGELIAFLYARSFPKSEWRARFDEALRGMNNF